MDPVKTGNMSVSSIERNLDFKVKKKKSVINDNKEGTGTNGSKKNGGVNGIDGNNGMMNNN